jgi:hypothetical protein
MACSRPETAELGFEPQQSGCSAPLGQTDCDIGSMPELLSFV